MGCMTNIGAASTVNNPRHTKQAYQTGPGTPRPVLYGLCRALEMASFHTDEHEQLGVSAGSSGQVRAAGEMHRQALGLSETVLGKERPSTLMSMRNLVNVLS